MSVHWTDFKRQVADKVASFSVQTRNSHKVVSDSITIGTGAAHSAGDVVSTDAGEVMEFDFTGLIEAGGSGRINSILTTLNNNAVFTSGAGYDLHLFTVAPAAQATNAALDITTTELPNYVGKIATGTLVDLGSICAVYTKDLALDFKLATGSTKLYGKAVCSGGETTVTGKTLKFNLNAVTQ